MIRVMAFKIFCVSARQQLPGTISPQSAYVRLEHNGVCIWWPMFEESLSHCPINVTHFPFDNQRCYLVFESWKYNNSQLIINSSLMEETQYHYHESEQWELFGRYTLSILFSAVTRIFTALHGMQTRSSDENSVREKSEFIFIRETMYTLVDLSSLGWS